VWPVVLATFEWVGFAVWRQQREISPAGLALAVLITILPLGSTLLWAVRQSLPGNRSFLREYLVPLASIFYSCSVLIWFFSLLFWAYGNSFTYQLTHLDAVYVALGNLTTAGTGNLAPVDQTGRTIVSIQYVADLVYVTIILSVGINRLLASSDRGVATPGK
jgi:hypothetical protein